MNANSVSFAKEKTIKIVKDNSLFEQIRHSRSTYIIDDVIDLEGNALSLPASCKLEFIEEGCLINGIVIFNDTEILNPSFHNVRFKGKVINTSFDITNYGAVANADMDCSLIINDLISLEVSPYYNRDSKKIIVPGGTYYIDSPITLFAGWEAPITLEGMGAASTLCQRTDNEYILKIYECHYIKNLRLVYKNRQSSKNVRSVAIACQRAIFSLFENLTICKANTAFGYIKLEDAKKEALTGQTDQCYVSCNFRNIRIYEFSNYAFDFLKELSQGDSGSSYDNIYINSNDWLGNSTDNVARGAIRGFNTVATFSQLNIEGTNYTSPLIDLNGMSRFRCSMLHVEGLNNPPSFFYARIQSLIDIDVVDIQACYFSDSYYHLSETSDNGFLNLRNFVVREDCRKRKNGIVKLRSGDSRSFATISIGYLLDPCKIFQ